jgi:hypothetical protein
MNRFDDTKPKYASCATIDVISTYLIANARQLFGISAYEYTQINKSEPSISLGN